MYNSRACVCVQSVGQAATFLIVHEHSHEPVYSFLNAHTWRKRNPKLYHTIDVVIFALLRLPFLKDLQEYRLSNITGVCQDKERL